MYGTRAMTREGIPGRGRLFWATNRTSNNLTGPGNSPPVKHREHRETPLEAAWGGYRFFQIGVGQFSGSNFYEMFSMYNMILDNGSQFVYKVFVSLENVYVTCMSITLF